MLLFLMLRFKTRTPTRLPICSGAGAYGSRFAFTAETVLPVLHTPIMWLAGAWAITLILAQAPRQVILFQAKPICWEDNICRLG